MTCHQRSRYRLHRRAFVHPRTRAHNPPDARLVRCYAWLAPRESLRRPYHLIANVDRLDLFPRQTSPGHKAVEHHYTDQFFLAQFCQLHSVTEMVTMGMRHQDMTRMIASQIFAYRRSRWILVTKRNDIQRVTIA